MPDLNMPRQVREQIARANEISAAMLTPPSAPPADPATDSPALAAPDQSAPAAQAPATTAAPQVAADKDGQAGDAIFWRNNYLAMRGRLDASAAESRQAITTMTQQLTDMSAELARVKAETPRAAAPAPAPAQVLTDEDRNRFGDGVVDLVQRGAQAEVQRAVAEALAPLRDENKALRDQLAAQGAQVQQVAATAATTAADRFFAALTAARPDWEAVNARQAWIAHMGEVDPRTNVTYQAYVDDAAAKQDVGRMVALLNEFDPPALKPAAAQDTRPALSPTPRSVGAAALPTTRDDAAAPIVTRAEIARFYTDVAAGMYRNRPADKQAFENQINEALKTNRVGA